MKWGKREDEVLQIKHLKYKNWTLKVERFYCKSKQGGLKLFWVEYESNIRYVTKMGNFRNVRLVSPLLLSYWNMCKAKLKLRKLASLQVQTIRGKHCLSLVSSWLWIQDIHCQVHWFLELFRVLLAASVSCEGEHCCAVQGEALTCEFLWPSCFNTWQWCDYRCGHHDVLWWGF